MDFFFLRSGKKRWLLLSSYRLIFIWHLPCGRHNVKHLLYVNYFCPQLHDALEVYEAPCPSSHIWSKLTRSKIWPQRLWWEERGDSDWLLARGGTLSFCCIREMPSCSLTALQKGTTISSRFLSFRERLPESSADGYVALMFILDIYWSSVWIEK